VEEASYAGRRALALVFAQELGRDRTRVRVYVDGETFLPLAREVVYLVDGRDVAGLRVTYEHEFLRAESLAPDFFDPRSIGYGMADPDALLDQVAREVPVYWLGEEFEPGGGFDPLVLVRIRTEVSGAFGERFGDFAGLLQYETPSGIPAVNLFLWTPSGWDAFIQSEAGRFLLDPACADVRRAQTQLGEATVYVLPDLVPPIQPEALGPCRGRLSAPAFTDADFIAIVDLGDVVIDVRADPVGDYNSVAAIEAALRGLHAWQAENE
jgi:hypothetical protein